jgi:hypothetical protein
MFVRTKNLQVDLSKFYSDRFIKKCDPLFWYFLFGSKVHQKLLRQQHGISYFAYLVPTCTCLSRERVLVELSTYFTYKWYLFILCLLLRLVTSTRTNNQCVLVTVVQVQVPGTRTIVLCSLTPPYFTEEFVPLQDCVFVFFVFSVGTYLVLVLEYL